MELTPEQTIALAKLIDAINRTHLPTFREFMATRRVDENNPINILQTALENISSNNKDTGS